MTPLADLELPIFAYELLETVASVDIHTKMRPNLELIFFPFGFLRVVLSIS